VPMAEVRINDDDFGQRLKEMRVWLDSRRFTASSFTYFYLDPGMLVRVLFEIDDEAVAFARAFDGCLIGETISANALAPVAANAGAALWAD
jgi:hypothetical protein